MSLLLCITAEGGYSMRGSFMKKFVSVILALTMSVAALTACSKTTEESKETEAAVSKIVSLSPTVTEIVFALDMGSAVVGVTSYDDYPAEVFDIQQVGDTMVADAELIASLEPDVVFASDFISEETTTALSELGIEVIVISDGANFADTLSNINTVGAAIGATSQADALTADLQARYDAVVADATESDVSVYYVVGYGEYGDYTAGAGTFVDDMITAAGAVNAGAAADGWYISQEALIEADPDYIILPNWALDFADMEPYSSLTAVAEGRLVYVDANLFDRQGPRNIEAIELIQSIVAGEYAADAAA